MRALIDLLRRRPAFRALWLGNLTSELGDWMGWVAVSVYALGEGEGIVPLALAYAAHNLPVALVSPIAGVFADRLDRRALMIGAAAAEGVLTLIMMAVVLADALAWLPLVLLLRSGLAGVFVPAERAVLPRVVEREELLLANTIQSTTWSVIFSVGMALGGLLAALGPALALGLDALTFFVSVLLFWRLPSVRPEAPLDPAQRGARAPWAAIGAVAAELREAWRWQLPRPEVSRALFAKTALALAGATSWVLLYRVLWAAAPSIEAAAVIVGVMHGVRGVGTGVGPTLGTWLVRRGFDRMPLWHLAIFGALLGMTPLFLPLEHPAPLWVIGAGNLLWGIGGGTTWVFSSVTIQSESPDRLLGRLNAVDFFLFLVVQSGSAVVAALLIEGGMYHGAVGAGAAALGGLVWVGINLRARRLRRREATAPGA